MLYLISDWDDLINIFKDMPYESGLSYPKPFPGDQWIVEEHYWDTRKVEEARVFQVHVLIVGTNPAIKKNASMLKVDTIIGEMIKPSELLQWVETRQKERPKLMESIHRGVTVSLAGLIPTGGGAGKDTIVANLAGYLASIGKSVVVVDLDPFGTLDKRFKIESNFSIDLWKERFMNIQITIPMIQNSIPKTHLGFHLLPASYEGKVHEEETITNLGVWLPQAYDVVIWNLGSGNAGKSFFATLKQSDHIFLIGVGDRAKFETYEKVYDEYKVMLNVVPNVMFNRFYQKNATDFFEKSFSIPVFGYFLESRLVFDTTEQGKLVATSYPKEQFSRTIKQISGRILNLTEKEKKQADTTKNKEKKRSAFRLW